MKLLFDFFPIVLFFTAFKLKGIYVATATAIIASVIQIGWVYYKNKKVDPMLWVSLAVVAVFGGATLLLRNETFIKWKPTVLYWVFGCCLIASELVFGKNLIRTLLEKQIELPERIWRNLNLSWAVFFIFLGGVNLFVATHYSTNTWVNFKLFGIMGLMLVFVIGQSIMLSPYLKKDK
ncbi:MAG: septation protein A [Candidatus Aureabacteria bacterium]|nr:septation protein A [Candidatus Auribacterota bacterium]